MRKTKKEQVQSASGNQNISEPRKVKDIKEKEKSGSKAVQQNTVIVVQSPVVSYSETYTFTHNFQSFKISVGLSLPAENGDIEETYTKAVEFVRNKLNEKSQEISRFLSLNDSDNIEL